LNHHESVMSSQFYRITCQQNPNKTPKIQPRRGLQLELPENFGLGRGDGKADDWADIRAEAARAHNDRTADYLLGMPMLGDFLEEGLSMLGYSCEEFELNRL
jgi:hypothetical protein